MSVLIAFLVTFLCYQDGHYVTTTNVCETQAKTDSKRSISFVFDLTLSMDWNHNHEKLRAASGSIGSSIGEIFNSHDSLIDNLILATYNDAVSKVLKDVTDRDTFENYLRNIRPSEERGNYTGGSSMDAIKKVLEASHPSSHIYLFTDEGTASKPGLLETVTSLAIKKQSQVNVVVLCSDQCVDKTYIPLIKATDGKLFDLNNENLVELFKYIAESNKSKRTTLVDTDLSPGRQNITYEFDSALEDVMISAFGDRKNKMNFKIYKPNGTKAETAYTIMDVPGYKVFKISTKEPGKYTIEADSDRELTLSITAKPTLDFRHGFSIMKPSSLKATSVQPIEGKPSNILIQLKTPDENITLDSINIVDLDNRLINHFEAKALDDDECKKTYYATPLSPHNLFKISIVAHNSRTNETITRYSKPIAPQKPEPATPLSPSVKILEGPKVVASYKKPLQLSCVLTAYPKPTVIWENVELGSELPYFVSEIEPPYVYVSVLNVSNIEKSGKYRCKTSTGVSDDVEVTIAKFFEVIELPEDMYVVQYKEEATIPCKVNAYPPANVTWYFEHKILSNDENIVVSDDKLVIKHMQPGMVGSYSCDVRNTFQKNITGFNVNITGFESPKIRKDDSNVTVVQGNDIMFTCSLLAGAPTPVMTWTHSKNVDSNFKLQDANASIILTNVSKELSGTFTCEARNVAGSDQHNISLNVEYPPIVTIVKISSGITAGINNTQESNSLIIAVKGTTISLHCWVRGNPAPRMTWTLNGIVRDINETTNSENRLIFRASMKTSGIYTCEAKNIHGTASETIEVQYAVPVSIRPEKTIYNALVGEDIVLPCKSSGYPRPTINWFFKSTLAAASQKMFKTYKSGSLSLKNMQLNADGFYTCTAGNIAGAANVTYRVNIHYPPQIMNMNESMYRAVEGDRFLRIPCKATGNPRPIITWSFEDTNIPAGTQSHDIEGDGTLLIKNVDIKSRGYHSCKATNYLGNDKTTIYVDITRFPYYEDPPTSFVNVTQGEKSILDCPLPQEIGSLMRWYKNGKFITEGALVIAHVSIKDTGMYTCWVDTVDSSNTANVYVNVTVNSTLQFSIDPESSFEFQADLAFKLTNDTKPVAEEEGTFDGNKIYQRDCTLHIQDDFIGNTPFIPFETSMKKVGDFMYIPNNYEFTLSCPKEFTTIPKSEITITCKEGSHFEVDGKVYKFSDLKCTSNMMTKFEQKGFHCGHEHTELVDVGFMVGGSFNPVFEVCIDKMKYIPLYTKLTLRQTFAGVNPKHSEWFNYNLLPFNKEDGTCENQSLKNSILKKLFHTDTCCFGKRQLVSPKDVMPGFPQLVTYTNINVVPQWGTCNSENWNDMEERVRSLAKGATHNLLVWTGQAGQLTLPNTSNHITLEDRIQKHPVPKYLWKVIQDVEARKSVAIVQVNIPYLALEDAHGHVLCKDVCDEVRWMADGSWNDVTKGYTYCCQLWEFETAFGYINKFNRDHDLLV